MTRFILMASIFLTASLATFAGSNSDSSFLEMPLIVHTKTGDLFGTLTLPKDFHNGKVALIIAGSGPTDRNGNNPMMTNNSLQMLAHGLADHNIASVRYDKRGIGESRGAIKKEADLRFDDYVNDAKEWIDLLKNDKRFSKVVVIGHSEGSLIGMIAAHEKTDGFVSIAGAGRSADKILKEQLSKQPGNIKDLSFPIIDSLVSGKNVQNVPPMLFSLFRPSVQPYIISWFHYDPQIEIAKLQIPVLIVQGTNDIQVSTEDANMLAKTNEHAQLVLIENMNHIFKTVDGDRAKNVSTYNNPTLPISEKLLSSIVEFIKKA